MSLNLSPLHLVLSGLNIVVEISTASASRQGSAPSALSTITAMGHFDTGATKTSIDIKLAKYLKLISTGQSLSYTASGPQIMPNFAVDIAFPNTELSPFANLRISSCKLIKFDLSKALSNPNDTTNFGILIGRDIMSRWNIVWNGPSSTVFISD
jgi:hypothetical protein